MIRESAAAQTLDVSSSSHTTALVMLPHSLVTQILLFFLDRSAVANVAQ